MRGIGQLNKRIVLANPTETVNSSGGRTYTYSTIATVWAGVKQLAAARDNQGQIIERGEYLFEFRYNETLAPLLTVKTRITYDGKHYGIERIDKIGERDYRYAVIASVKSNGAV